MYYVDADWNRVVGAHQDQPDALTLKYLGIALAPLGENYTPRAQMGDVPVIADAGRTYTPDETVRLLQDYRLNRSGDYNNPQINEEYLVGKFDPVVNQRDFYWKNLFYGASLGETIEGLGTGLPLGVADGVVSTGQGILALTTGVFTDFQGVSSQMANGVMALLSGRGQEADTEKQAQSFLYLLQGNEIARARMVAKSSTEFALAMIPAGRAGALGKAGEIAAGEESAAGLLSRGAEATPSGLVSGETGFVDTGKAAANDADFGGAKGPAIDLPSGETKVVGDGTPAANDASFAGAEGPVQVIPDAINPPTVSSVEDLFGQTFESIPLSHLPNWKNGSLVNDGKLGEQLSLQTLNEKTGLDFKPLQNSSNHGCDGCAVAINGDTITVLVMDAKSSVNGVDAARTPHGDPETRLRRWLANRSITQSDPALAEALGLALQNGEVKVQGVTVKVGLPAPGKTGQAEIKVEPWPKK